MSLLPGIAILPVAGTIPIATMLFVRRRATESSAHDVGGGGAMNTFRTSASMKELVRKFGFTPDAATEVAREVAARNSARNDRLQGRS